MVLSGGLCLLWKQDFDLYIRSLSLHHIDALVGGNEVPEHWRMTSFYGFPATEDNFRSRQLLRTLASEDTIPWLCFGDFNELLRGCEKEGGAILPIHQMMADYKTRVIPDEILKICRGRKMKLREDREIVERRESFESQPFQENGLGCAGCISCSLSQKCLIYSRSLRLWWNWKVATKSRNLEVTEVENTLPLKIGLERQLIVAYSPQQNGITERKNRTIVEMRKAMMNEKKLPYMFWGEAVHTAVYIQNRCPTKALDNITSFEAFSGRKPGIKHLRVFYSICFCHVPSQLRSKLADSAVKCIFVGYGKCEKAYRVYNL
ncbi:hypothetical protein Prudu_012299 [Prunus dulcis]|uniref:Integrase catalytic domain-containing protein n=1 Tax=Prunus dulcis TaxID=3755 RepID=A0A4Y1RD13_PRUDU|nr:hypothetical protein Prudu_012299 [Prunus dulcis]